MDFLIIIVDILVRVISLLIVVHVFLSYFLSPYHPVRETLDRIVMPMLNPIRKFLPPTGMVDFSPFILLVLVQILCQVLISLLRAM